MNILLLLALGAGGVLAVTELTKKKKEPVGIVKTPQARELYRRADTVYQQWRTNTINDDTLETEIDKLAKTARNFRDQDIIPVTDGETLRKQRIAILAEADLLY